MRTDRLGVFVLYRRRRDGWEVLAIGPITALLALKRDRDLILPAGRVPEGFADPIPA